MKIITKREMEILMMRMMKKVMSVMILIVFISNKKEIKFN